jgi:protoporphyrinogen oxidase
MKKIAIIGGGFSALNLAWQLSSIESQEKLSVELFEKDKQLAGMAGGHKEKKWAWSLEKHYHHLFAKDLAFQNFLEQLGLEDQLFYQTSKTSTRWQNKNYQLDSAWSLLNFQELGLIDRLRTGLVLAFLKMLPDGQFLEKYAASVFLAKSMGQRSWQIIWQPLFEGKFANQAEEINMAWFWARVHPRTAKLGYVEGGFQLLAEQIQKKLIKKGVKFHLRHQVDKITAPKKQSKKNSQFKLKIKSLKNSSKKIIEKKFDLVISTLPSTQFSQLIDLKEFKNKNLTGLAAMTLILRLKDKLLKDDTYWLNINEKDWPFLAVVEHTNFINKKYFNGEHLVYVGKYLSNKDPSYQYSAKKMWQNYLPFLQKINPQVKELLIDYRLSKESFAQPLVKINHSQNLPPMRTSHPYLYWVSMQHIYPYDRGLNFAVAQSNQLFKLIKQDLGI